MKKAANLLLSLLTIAGIQLSATPVIFTFHYCGGELMEVKANDWVEPCCPTDTPINQESASRSCCTLDVQQIASHSSAVQSKTAIAASISIAPLYFTVAPILIPSIQEDNNLNLANAPPPIKSGWEICIQNEQFLL